MTSYVYRVSFPSGHYYIGVKKGTPEKTQNYVGSPKRNKWMWDQFPVLCKEILWETETFERALEIEENILNDLDYHNDVMCLNANSGGHIPTLCGEKHPGYGKPSPMSGKNHSDSAKEKTSESQKANWNGNKLRKTRASESMKQRWDDEKFAENVSKTMTKTNERLWSDPNFRERRSQTQSERVSGEKNPFYGQRHTDATKEKLKEAWIRRRERGVSDETRQKMSDAANKKPIVECPYCGLTGRGPNMKRYHLDNCKHKKG